MVSARRIGSEGSETRLRLLETAAELMRTEGHSNVTVRRLAEKAGLKRQLVHYYFRSMETLFIEVVRRSCDLYLERQIKALQRPNPARAIWELASNPVGARLEIEFLALGNQFDSVRKVMAEYSENSRKLQVAAIRQVLDTGKVKAAPRNPEAIVLTLRGIARALVMEAATGISSGHAETIAEVEQYLRYFDPQDES